MITDAFMDVLHGLAGGLFGWLANTLPGAPNFWTEGTDALSMAMGLVPSQVLYFIPVYPVAMAATAVLGLILLLGGLRLARRVVSLFTGGGGMA